MKFLSRLISSLLSLTIILTVSAYVLSTTIWNQAQLQKATDKAAIADKVAAALPDMLKSSLGLTEDETFIIKTVATKDRIKPYIDQITAKIAKSDGLPLQIDLGEIRRAIVSESLPLTSTLDDVTAKPLTVIPAEQSAKLAAVKHDLDQIKIFGPVIAIVLVALVMVLAKHSRFIVLGESAIMIALGLGLIGLILPSIPGLVTSSIGASAAAPLQGTVTAFMKSLLDVAQTEYYRAALVAAIISVLSFIAHFVDGIIRKFSKNKHHA